MKMKMKDKIKNQDKSDAALPARTEALLRALLPFGVKWVTTGDQPDGEFQIWDSEPTRDSEYGVYYCSTGRYLGSIFIDGLGLEPFARINVEELAE